MMSNDENAGCGTDRPSDSKLGGLRLLISASAPKFFHTYQLSLELSKMGARCKMVGQIQSYDGFPAVSADKRQARKTFREIASKFKPDLVLADWRSHFTMQATREGIPLLLILKGDYWTEAAVERQLLPKMALKRRIALSKRSRFTQKHADGASLILAVSNGLEAAARTRLRHQDRITTMHCGIDPEIMSPENGIDMGLRHPSVGLVQQLNRHGKAAEVLVLEDAIRSMPEVTFYLAGDGCYRDTVMSRLGRYDNFVHLGPLRYPDGVRNFLASIDVYALASTIDTLSLSTIEAQMMQRPVVVSRISGVPEAMREGKSGFLVDCGDGAQWRERISMLINDAGMARRMGEEGRRFASENLSVRTSAEEFAEAVRVFGLWPRRSGGKKPPKDPKLHASV